MKAAGVYRVRRALGGALLFGSLVAPALAQQSGCELHVAPFFRGTGGFVAKPSDGRSVGVTVRRGSSSRAETLFARSDGLVVQLLNSSTTASLCSDGSGAPVECRISFTGIENGGWYWVNGDRNAAVAPLVCADELDGAEALDPGGVAVTRSEHGTATLFVHDAQKLMGIIPHLASPAAANSCQERVAPIFRGGGGYVLKPASGASPVVTFEDGGSTETRNLDVRPEDGLAVGLLSSPLCPGAADRPVACRVSFSGVEDGGWYWVNGDRNAAVAPLVCAEQLGGAGALDPGGVAVTASTRGTGTLIVHETQNLMAIVPHLAEVPTAADLVVESPALSASNLMPGERFTLSAEVFNRGGGGSAATTVRWYRSSDSGIDTSDTEVGTSSLAALDASARATVSVDLQAPSDNGTHWYGACVEAVGGEADTGNNCSGAAALQVGPSGGSGAVDLVVESPAVSASSLGPDERFTLSADVVNRGKSASAATTVRWYRSSDSGIATSDTEVGTSSLAALDASARATASVDLDAPSEIGTYWYGACVEAVAGESDTGNNCSSGAMVEVGLPGDFDLASENDAAHGITYADERFYVVDETDDKVYVYDSRGSHVASADFALDSENDGPAGITYALGRLYVLDRPDDKVYVYESSGNRVASADFSMDSQNVAPNGITYALGRFYVVNGSRGSTNTTVYAYGSDGSRTASADFTLDSVGMTESHSRITYALGYFYVVRDSSDNLSRARVHAYASGGSRTASEDLTLDAQNGDPTGMTYAGGRFYVLDTGDDKVFAYDGDGSRVP